MKVLHLSYNDWGAAGGTSVATCRLHWGLQKAGMESKILCRVNRLDDSVAIRRLQVMERALKEILSCIGLNDLQGISSFWLKNYPVYKEADVLNIHSLHSGYFNYLALPGLTRQKPTVWTIHDIWALTGHCSFPYECERWKTGCGQCPHLDTFPAVKRDATALDWKLKNWAYKNSKIHLIATSPWLLSMIKESMLGHLPVTLIPFGIDHGFFKPIDKKEARQQLGVPQDRKVLLFATARLNDPRKNGKLIKEALKRLPDTFKKDIFLITTGAAMDPDDTEFGVDAKHLGVLDNELMAHLYSAADVFLFPTKAETFGLVALESMACGTPVLACRAGGILGHVRHGQTGHVCEPEDPTDFAKGIERLLSDGDYHRSLSETARRVVLQEYTETLQIRRYLDLYKDLLKS